MFFRLNAFAFLVAGEKDYSIYDMKNNFIYMLNREAGMLIKRLENNVDLDTLKEYEKHKNVCMDFLGMLAQKGLGDFFENEVHIEKFRFNAPIQKKGMLEPVPQYVKCYLEISNECNLKCSFCGKSKYINWLGCQSCFRNQNHQEASIKYDKLVSELEEIGVKELILGGREPFCKSKVIYKLIEQCKKNSRINLIITTPGSVEANEILKVSSLYEKIKLNIVVFATRRFSEFLSEEMQEFIRKQEKLFSVLHKNNIPYSVTLQIYDKNRNYAEAIIRDIKTELGITPMIADIVDMEKREKLTHIGMNQKMLSQYRNPREFYLRKSYNPCLYGVFSIDLFGNVNPCPGIHKALGNITDNTLHEILSKDDLYSYWTYSKDKVVYCKNCSMRYFCSDCSVFELASHESSNVHNMFCPANIEEKASDISNVEFVGWNKEYLSLDY